MDFIKRSSLFLLLLLPLLCATPTQAGSWPKIETALTGWEGLKQVTLRTDQPEPLASPEVQGLLELLLEQGFVVVPAAPDATAEDGLILDHRTTPEGAVLALSRAADRAIIAFERNRGPIAPPAMTTSAPNLEPRVQPMGPSAAPSPVQPPSQLITQPVIQPLSQPVGPWDALPTGPIEIFEEPTGLAVLGHNTSGEIDFVVQSGPMLRRFMLTGQGLNERSRIKAPVDLARPLHLDRADVNGDGQPELAAGWVEDLRGIYQGTESQLHAWIFTPEDQDLRLTSGDLTGYVRSVADHVFLQGRGTYTPFSGPILPLLMENGGFTSGTTPSPWGQGNLYDVTPISAEEGLAWDKAGRLQVVSLTSGTLVPGTTLLADLGEYRGPEVAIPLETPEYRSGFSKEDQVREIYYPLPRRMSIDADGAVYTINRGRTSGLPLIGKPSGHDALVRVVRNRQGLHLERPFPGVEAYILDFALLDGQAQPPAALLLLNEKGDGSGRSWLQIAK